MASTPRDESGWTIETYSAHNEALRDAEKDLQAERDLRYSQVAAEREKALQIKEKADDRALDLAREIQTYKDEKANELRSQIERERGTYLSREEYVSQHNALADKVDTALKPLTEFVAGQQGRREGISSSTAVLYGVLGLLVAIISAIVIYTTRTNHANSPVVTCSATYHPAPCP